MSSSSQTSSYVSDDSDDESNFGPGSTRGRKLQQSSSRSQNNESQPVTISDSSDYSTQSEDENEDVPNSSQGRWERLNELVEAFDGNALDRYTELLKDFQEYVPLGIVHDHTLPYPASQNGAVVWTREEKEIMFNALDRKGKLGIHQIADIVGTKSALEVADYLQLLQRSLAGPHLEMQKLQSTVMGDIPAAIEVSKECSDELDKSAQAAVLRDDLVMEKNARLQYGNNALISEFEATNLVAMEENPPLPGNIHLAANLLNVPGFVRLPADFFMNFGGTRADDCWHNIVRSRSETPSIYSEALMDFYAIVMSITRRLVQSSIFFALARLRSLEKLGRARNQDVRKSDIKAALDVLNMKPDRAGFFVDVARRNQIAIVKESRNERKPLSYEEVEEYLRPRKSANESETDAEVSSSDSGTEEIDKSASEEVQSKSDTDASPEPTNEPSQPKVPWDLIPLDTEEEHADLLDLETSRREEIDLWKILGTPAPSFLEKAIPQCYRPPVERKSREDLTDWRDHTLYRTDWEEYGEGMQDLEKDLATNRLKRLRPSDDVETELSIERPRRNQKRVRIQRQSGEDRRARSAGKDREQLSMATAGDSPVVEDLRSSVEDDEMGEADAGQDPIVLDDEDEDDRVERDEVHDEIPNDNSDGDARVNVHKDPSPSPIVVDTSDS